MGTTIREGSWDCSNCGMTRIPASQKVCPRPGCGDPQNSVLTPSEDWYLQDDARVVTDSVELAKANAGEAWNCEHCGTLNDGDATVCRYEGCGRPLDFDDTVNREVTYDDRADHFDTKPDPRDEVAESVNDRAERAITTKASGPRKMKNLTLPGDQLPTVGEDTEFYEGIRTKAASDFDERIRVSKLPPIVQKLLSLPRKPMIIGGAIVAVLVVIGVVFGIVHAVQKHYATVPGTVTISELHWVRNVEVEEYKTLTDSDWSYPSDARIQNSENRIRTYRTVHDGWHTENYTDYETRYKSESYTDYETRYRSESYSGTCSRTVSKGNGYFADDTYSCPQTRQVSYTVPVEKTRQVSYTVPVPKSRQVEDTHQEPVWDTWYTYQVDRWVTDRWVTASDTTSAKVDWPKVTDLHQDASSGDQVGEERVGDERKENYDVGYTDSKGTKRSDQEGYELWSKLEMGETVPALYYQRNGELSSVDWESVLKPAA